jgi:hypothetical protein
VDFPARRWDSSIEVGDVADAVVRRSFFGDQYDGLAIRQAQALLLTPEADESATGQRIGNAIPLPGPQVRGSRP